MIKFVAKLITKWLLYEKPIEGFPLSDYERIRYEVRPCDVILIEGRSRVSEVIQAITQSAWSHSALYIGRLHDIENEQVRAKVAKAFNGKLDTQLIIEGMLGKGTIISDLESYRHEHIRICRPRGLSPGDGQRVINYAVSKLGLKYDVRHIFDLARFFFPWTILPRRWRSSLFALNAGESTKAVCSSMMGEAFNYVDFPILPLIKRSDTKGIELIKRNPKLLTPSAFDYSPYFDIIKYPFIELEQNALYRKLPWNKDNLYAVDGMNTIKIPEGHYLYNQFDFDPTPKIEELTTNNEAIRRKVEEVIEKEKSLSESERKSEDERKSVDENFNAKLQKRDDIGSKSKKESLELKTKPKNKSFFKGFIKKSNQLDDSFTKSEDEVVSNTTVENTTIDDEKIDKPKASHKDLDDLTSVKSIDEETSSTQLENKIDSTSRKIDTQENKENKTKETKNQNLPNNVKTDIPDNDLENDKNKSSAGFSLSRIKKDKPNNLEE